jgi:uncharacterized protein YggE
MDRVICSADCFKLFAALRRRKQRESLVKAMPSVPTSIPPIITKEEKNTLNVEGRGEVKVTPDRVRVTLVIIKKADTVSAVNRGLIESSEKLISLLRDKTNGKAEKIQTKALSIEPIRQKSEQQIKDEQRGVYNNDYQGVIVAYEGKFPISFESAIADAGAIIDVALQTDEADEVEGLSYIVSDSIAKNAYNKALQLATLDAGTKSKIVLDTLGMRKTGILSINIDDTYHSLQTERSEDYASFAPRAKMATSMQSMQLIAGETEIVATVRITFSYE